MIKLQEPQAEKAHVYDAHYRNRLLVLLVGVMFTVFYIETMITPSLPSFTTEFGVSIAQASLVIAFYAMSGTALVPVIGKLGDVYGKKRILVYVLFIYAAAVSITSFSPNFTFLLVTRIVQGIGISISPLVFSLVREEFPRDKLPKAVGLLSGMSGAGLGSSSSSRFINIKLLWLARNLSYSNTICNCSCGTYLRASKRVSV